MVWLTMRLGRTLADSRSRAVPSQRSQSHWDSAASFDSVTSRSPRVSSACEFSVAGADLHRAVAPARDIGVIAKGNGSERDVAHVLSGREVYVELRDAARIDLHSTNRRVRSVLGDGDGV